MSAAPASRTAPSTAQPAAINLQPTRHNIDYLTGRPGPTAGDKLRGTLAKPRPRRGHLKTRLINSVACDAAERCLAFNVTPIGPWCRPFGLVRVHRRAKS